MTPEFRRWLPSFLHWYPGITPEAYGELAYDDWVLLRAAIEAATRASRTRSGGR